VTQADEVKLEAWNRVILSSKSSPITTTQVRVPDSRVLWLTELKSLAGHLLPTPNTYLYTGPGILDRLRRKSRNCKPSQELYCSQWSDLLKSGQIFVLVESLVAYSNLVCTVLIYITDIPGIVLLLLNVTGPRIRWDTLPNYPCGVICCAVMVSIAQNPNSSLCICFHKRGMPLRSRFQIAWRIIPKNITDSTVGPCAHRFICILSKGIYVKCQATQPQDS